MFFFTYSSHVIIYMTQNPIRTTVFYNKVVNLTNFYVSKLTRFSYNKRNIQRSKQQYLYTYYNLKSVNLNENLKLKLEAQVSLYRSHDINKSS